MKRIQIDRIDVRLIGVPPETARELTDGLAGAVGRRLAEARLTPARITTVDAGTVAAGVEPQNAAVPAIQRRTAEAVARALAAATATSTVNR